MSETTATTAAKPQIPTFGRENLSPGAYNLDLSRVFNAPMKLNGQPATLGEVYCKLRDSRIKEIQHVVEDTYITEEGDLHLDGEIAEWPLRATMRELAELLLQGIDPYLVTWFYYSHDWSRDADESYQFFAVHKDKIVMESSSFNWLEPRVLKLREVDAEPVWHSRPYLDEGWEQYWYRKFYTETVTGQLMVLRPDEPTLYHYERPQTRDVFRELQIVTAAKIYRLILVVVPILAAIAFPSFRGYLAIAAAVLGLEFLRMCWVTRKVGRP